MDFVGRINRNELVKGTVPSNFLKLKIEIYSGNKEYFIMILLFYSKLIVDIIETLTKAPCKIKY